MELGISFNCFEGTELLPYALKQIRSHVDVIVIHYQMKSWYGQDIKQEDFNILKQLQKDKLIDYLLLFKIDQYAKTPAEAKLLEREKRNRARLFCLEKGCTHFIDCDVDEFYKEEEFKNAKQFIIDNKYDYTAVNLVDYFHLPIFKKKSFNSCIVPFICKLTEKVGLGGAKFLGKTDPTRGYNTTIFDKTYLFPSNQLVGHHMVGVRKDLLFKYVVTSRGKLDRNKIPEIIDNIKSITVDSINNNTIQKKFGNIGNEFEIVENIFNIPLEDF